MFSLQIWPHPKYNYKSALKLYFLWIQVLINYRKQRQKQPLVEKNRLVELSEKNTKCAVTKKKDAVTYEIKNNNWNMLANTFNAHYNVLRTADRLRNKYKSFLPTIY